MSENQNCGIGDLSQFDVMTTEELEEILRLDAEMPEGQESDTEKILYIMEVLAQRNKQNRTFLWRKMRFTLRNLPICSP